MKTLEMAHFMTFMILPPYPAENVNAQVKQLAKNTGLKVPIPSGYEPFQEISKK